MEDYRNKSRFLYGESMGGALTLLLHRKDPAFWDGAVLVAPMCKVCVRALGSIPMDLNLLLGCWSVDCLRDCRYQRRWNHTLLWSPSWPRWRRSSPNGRSSRPKISLTPHSRIPSSAKRSLNSWAQSPWCSHDLLSFEENMNFSHLQFVETILVQTQNI